MGSLDEHIVRNTPVPLLSSLLPQNLKDVNSDFDFTRYRDDGINFLLHQSHKDLFFNHLNSANQHISWTSPDWSEFNDFGLKADYLDLLVKLENGFIQMRRQFTLGP